MQPRMTLWSKGIAVFSCGIALLLCVDSLSWAQSPYEQRAPIVGRWQAVQGASELLELAADGTMRSTVPGDPHEYIGVYRVDGQNLEYAFTMPQGVRKSTMTMVSLTNAELILRSQVTGQLTVYKRAEGGQAIAPHDTRRYARLIIGRWESVGPREVMQFTSDGKLFITGGDSQQYSGVYQMFGDRLEYALNSPLGVQKAQMSIVSLSETEMHLLSPSNTRASYRRVEANLE